MTNTLDPQLIIKHLDKRFVYDSQWTFESLKCEEYISYIIGTFETIRKSNNKVKATIVNGAVKLDQNGNIVFYWKSHATLTLLAK